MKSKFYWLIVIVCFSMVIGVVISTPQVDTIYKNKKNEDFFYIANITGARKVEVYLEYQNTWSTIDLTEINYLANQSFPIVESYTVNQLSITENYIYVDIEFSVNKDIQRVIDRVCLVMYGKYGGVYIHEIY